MGMSVGENGPEGQPQRTLRHSIGCVGIGLHSGARVALTLHPADLHQGIRFRRADRPGSRAIPALCDHVVETGSCTTLGLPGGPRVAMVEHLMAALAACQVTNLLIEVSGPELPIMDGSAQPFIFLMECAGIEVQSAECPVIEIVRPVSVSSDTGWAALEPDSELVLECRIESDNRVVGVQERAHTFRPDLFRSEIAPARTFGFADAVEDLRLHDHAPGSSLKNAVVVAKDRVLNEEGLRFRDEFVRHRLLDSVGNLQLAGARLRGRHVSRRADHQLEFRLLKAVFADPANWRLVAGDFPLGSGSGHVAAAARA
jgi:UDP-3-O-[3-hydroxymyristoyl] N-acetylglucosamine deacetylase